MLDQSRRRAGEERERAAIKLMNSIFGRTQISGGLKREMELDGIHQWRERVQNRTDRAVLGGAGELIGVQVRHLSGCRSGNQ